MQINWCKWRSSTILLVAAAGWPLVYLLTLPTQPYVVFDNGAKIAVRPGTVVSDYDGTHAILGDKRVRIGRGVTVAIQQVGNAAAKTRFGDGLAWTYELR